MKLKGSTKIELTDVHTGKKEIYRDTNMVTKAVSQVFGNNIEGMLFCVAGSSTVSWSDYFLPICPNTIGGILLFQDAITEDENTIYAPSSNQCIGYASNDVNATANVLRGSLNLTESKTTDKGYKFVWDFTTSQGNGTITAVCLTHKQGGVGYFGDTFDAEKRLLRMKSPSTVSSGLIMNRYVDMVEVNFEGNYFISISMDTSNAILINKVRKSFCNIGLNFNLQENGDELLETHTINPTVFINSTASSNYGYYDFIDGEDGYWYGFMAGSNSSGNATVKWIKISKADFTFTDGTWTLTNAQLYQIGYRSGYGGQPYRNIQSVMRGGYLYAMKYDRKGIYKINANNSADITLIPFGFTSNFSGGDSYGYVQMYKIGDRILGSDFNICSDDTIICTKNYTGLNYVCTPFFRYGPYAISFGRYSYSTASVYKTLFLVTPYLASINNLSTSVIKTADKTMKITYTVEEA